MKIWHRLIEWVAGFFTCRAIIGKDGKLYLARFVLFGDGGNITPADPKQCARFSLFLHYFERPDIDRELHSHPWRWSFSLVLSGGYLEERLNYFRSPNNFGSIEIFRRPFRLNIFREGDFHKIKKINSPCWTLFFAGPKIADWGFLVQGRGIVDHAAYFRERGEVVEPETKDENNAG